MNKIWDQAERTGYVMARCGDTNVTDEDIISLKGNNWLTDQVKIYKIYTKENIADLKNKITD